MSDNYELSTLVGTADMKNHHLPQGTYKGRKNRLPFATLSGKYDNRAIKHRELFVSSWGPLSYFYNCLSLR